MGTPSAWSAYIESSIRNACLLIPWLAASAQVSVAQESGRRDLLVLLPNSPLHVRLTVTDGDKTMEDLRSAYIDRLITTLDVDKDGKLSSNETKKHALFMTGRRFSDTDLAKSLPPARTWNRATVEQSIERAIGQSLVFRQIATGADQDLQVFKLLDDDQSGLIERKEMRTAAGRFAKRDLDRDHCITFDECGANASIGMMPELPMPTLSSETPPIVHSEMLRDIKEPVLPARLIKAYDTDRDGRLSGSELGWDDDRVAALDTNKDQLLAVGELTKLASAEPDIAIKIELSKNKDNGNSRQDSLWLVSARPNTNAKLLDAGVVELRQKTSTVSVTYRDRDPIEEAMRGARETFNAIDLDTNGYMDREEITTHPRFQRYLFDAMDSDGDDRVFGKEMDDYVMGIAEPSSTTCQVTLFESGNGYFQMLDKNGDGRISVRELRSAEAQLLSFVEQGSDMLNPSQLPRYYRIEVQRGGPSPFGVSNRPRLELPQPVIRNNQGPVWFQRMDRNGDSDLVWDEFLGPRHVFDALDTDKDGLLDPEEASKAK